MSETKIEWVIHHRGDDGVWYEQGTKYESEPAAKDGLKRRKDAFPKEEWKLIKRTTVTTEEIVK